MCLLAAATIDANSSLLTTQLSAQLALLEGDGQGRGAGRSQIGIDLTGRSGVDGDRRAEDTSAQRNAQEKQDGATTTGSEIDENIGAVIAQRLPG